MNKREFLKSSGALLTGALLKTYGSGEAMQQPRTNWSGNYTFHTDHLLAPKTLEETRKEVVACGKLRALGSAHSFNGIADSTANQISLMYLEEMDLDAKEGTVTVGAGVTYGRLAPYLDSRGFALHNLASLLYITVVGACQTATHGSGVKNRNLSAAVRAMQITAADGRLATLSPGELGGRFDGSVVALGALGVVTSITLAVEPTYRMSQVVYRDLSMDRLKNHLEEIFSSGYSVSLFTDWQNHRIAQVWIKSRLPGAPSPAPPEFFGAKLATRNLHPIEGHSAESCTEQMGIPGPWYERLPHFKMNFTPSNGAELQTEYFVPLERGYEAILAVEELRDRITPHLFVTELRTVAADNLWISPAYRRQSMTIHFTWKREWPQVREILPAIEERLAPFQARPHWAKLFTIPPSRLHQLYTQMPAYRALLQQYDSGGKFRNAFIRQNIFEG